MSLGIFLHHVEFSQFIRCGNHLIEFLYGGRMAVNFLDKFISVKTTDQRIQKICNFFAAGTT